MDLVITSYLDLYIVQLHSEFISREQEHEHVKNGKSMKPYQKEILFFFFFLSIYLFHLSRGGSSAGVGGAFQRITHTHTHTLHLQTLTNHKKKNNKGTTSPLLFTAYNNDMGNSLLVIV